MSLLLSVMKENAVNPFSKAKSIRQYQEKSLTHH